MIKFIIGLKYDILTKAERIKVKKYVKRALKPKLHDYDNMVFMTFDSLDTLFSVDSQVFAEELAKEVNNKYKVKETKIRDLNFFEFIKK